jgi:hypothetical protein
MMKALILKDIRIQIPTVVFAATYPFFLLGLLAVIGGAPFGARMILILSSVVMPYMVVMGSFKELRNKTENFILSLPILRKDIANGKFLLLGISTIIAAGICFLAIGIYAGACRIARWQYGWIQRSFADCIGGHGIEFPCPVVFSFRLQCDEDGSGQRYDPGSAPTVGPGSDQRTWEPIRISDNR